MRTGPEKNLMSIMSGTVTETFDLYTMVWFIATLSLILTIQSFIETGVSTRMLRMGLPIVGIGGNIRSYY